MAGTPRGLIDVQFGNGVDTGNDMNQALFITLYRFFSTVDTNATIIASNFGSGGTGFDYYDEANPAGTQAFFVVQKGKLYILVQWSIGPWGTYGPGSPARLDGLTNHRGVGFAAALRADGGSPWNGTTNADGTDTKGTPVWVDGGSTLHVLDYSTEPGNTYATDKENLQQIGDPATAANWRCHIVGDDDLVFFSMSASSLNLANYASAVVGRFDPITNVSIPDPYVFLASWNNPWTSGTGTTYGSATGSSTRGGGVVNSAAGVSTYHLVGPHPDYQTLTLQPNKATDVDRLDGSRWGISVKEPLGDAGFIGTVPPSIVALVVGAVTQSTNIAVDRAYLLPLSTDTAWSMVWDGGGSGLAPGAVTNRTGRTF